MAMAVPVIPVLSLNLQRQGWSSIEAKTSEKIHLDQKFPLLTFHYGHNQGEDCWKKIRTLNLRLMSQTVLRARILKKSGREVSSFAFLFRIFSFRIFLILSAQTHSGYFSPDHWVWFFIWELFQRICFCQDPIRRTPESLTVKPQFNCTIVFWNANRRNTCGNVSDMKILPN